MFVFKEEYRDLPPRVEKFCDVLAQALKTRKKSQGYARDEPSYILDPADITGPDYPSETFRALRESERSAHGEYRSRRLVLETWDAQERGA